MQRRPSVEPSQPRPGARAPVLRRARAAWLRPAAFEQARAACRAAVERGLPRGRVRVWMPGCDAGGTTYAIAMLLADAAARLPSPPKIVIFGTDDDEEALRVARLGRYPARAALGLDPELRSRHAVDEGDTIRVSEALRELCIFSRHELMRDPPMARMDLVVCRRTFESVPVSKRAELADALHHALRGGGLLLAFDHVEWFSTEHFEPSGAGLLRARPLPQRAARRPASAGAHGRADELASKPLGAPSEPGLISSLMLAPGLPLVLCDAQLRLLFASGDAQSAFELWDVNPGAHLESFASRLPGGVELLGAAWRARSLNAPQQLSIRAGGRAYLARISAAAEGISISFTDVTQLELAKSQAVAQQHQQAAIARISDLALTLADPLQLYDEGLAALFGNIPSCSGGAMLELTGEASKLEVVASRGLGSDPLRALRGLGEISALIDTVLERGRAVRAECERTFDSRVSADSPRPLRSSPIHSSPSAPVSGLACPVQIEDRLVGVLALFGRDRGICQPEYQHFVQAVANVLGGAIARQRTRRRQQLELAVSTLLAGAGDLATVGRGLRAALGVVPGLEQAEVWAAEPDSASRWSRRVPAGDSGASEPSWSAAVFPGLANEPIELPSESAGRDLLVPIHTQHLPAHVLRLWGMGLRALDPELAEGLRRVARMLGEFFERSTILERLRISEAAHRQKTAELEALYASLSEADRQKDDFLALLGHELRNPMAAIRNATELLGRIEQPPPQLARLHRIFERQTLQTTKLIDGLLDIARVARGKVELEIKPIAIVDLVRQVVDDRRSQFQNRTLDLQLPEAELWVQADRVRLVQILDNLISNALKFTAPGGRILIAIEHSVERGTIRIADDGIGIDPELLPQIFEPFRQGPSQAQQAQAGLGLGLALVKALVDLHGFELRHDSAGPGCGATFEIDFPLGAALETDAPESRVDTRSLSVLLIEDNEDIAETLGELLGSSGHRVRIAGSAEEGLTLLAQGRPDVVLCDVGLPGMDGVALARRVRADAALADLTLVAMTGFGDASTQRRVEEAGFDRMLIKPVQLDALQHCLSRLVARSMRRVSQR